MAHKIEPSLVSDVTLLPAEIKQVSYLGHLIQIINQVIYAIYTASLGKLVALVASCFANKQKEIGLTFTEQMQMAEKKFLEAEGAWKYIRRSKAKQAAAVI